MTDVKTYSSKSNAARAFRAQYGTSLEGAVGMSTAQIAEAGYIDEDSPGKWVVNDPATLAQHDTNDYFEMSAEELAKQAVRPSVIEVETAGGTIEVDLTKLAVDPSRNPGGVVEYAINNGTNSAGQPAVPPQALEVANVSLPKSGKDGKCPHCGVHTLGGDPKRVTEFSEMSPGSQATTDHQFTCNKCAGEWGPAVEKTRKSRAPKVRSSLTSPVKFMWDMLDAEPGLARKDAVARGIAAGVSPNTAATQFQWWRKARGLVGKK